MIPITASRVEAGTAATTTTRSRWSRSEEHTSELQSPCNLVCRLLLEKKKNRPRYLAVEYLKNVRGRLVLPAMGPVFDWCSGFLMISRPHDSRPTLSQSDLQPYLSPLL